jgi:hypothetical protein
MEFLSHQGFRRTYLITTFNQSLSALHGTGKAKCNAR